MAKGAADYGNTAGTGHPPGAIATNGAHDGASAQPVINTYGHSAKSLDRDGH